MGKIWKYIQYLSLDVVAGAVISCLFVAKMFDVGIDLYTLLGLGIAIWLIYTADHLLDARNIGEEARNPRHRFHQQHFKTLLVVGMIVFGLGIWNITNLPTETIIVGAVLIALVGIYFLSLQLQKKKSLWHKETSAAFIYSFGIFAGPLSLSLEFEWFKVFLFCQFLLIVLLNLLIFPIYELESDRQDNMKSLVIALGGARMKRIINLIFALNVVAFAYGLFGFSGYGDQEIWLNGQLILLLMLSVLYLLFRWPTFFQTASLYRVLGDGIFLLTGIILL